MPADLEHQQAISPTRITWSERNTMTNIPQFDFTSTPQQKMVVYVLNSLEFKPLLPYNPDNVLKFQTLAHSWVHYAQSAKHVMDSGFWEEIELYPENLSIVEILPEISGLELQNPKTAHLDEYLIYIAKTDTADLSILNQEGVFVKDDDFIGYKIFVPFKLPFYNVAPFNPRFYARQAIINYLQNRGVEVAKLLSPNQIKQVIKRFILNRSNLSIAQPQVAA